MRTACWPTGASSVRKLRYRRAEERIRRRNPARRAKRRRLRGNTRVIAAFVPLAEMFGYASDVRSKTQGREAYTMQFHSYEAVPNNVAEEVVATRANRKNRG